MSLNQGRIVAALALLACGLASASPVRAADSGNLVINGDFTAGRCATDWSTITSIPGWTLASGAPALVCYGAGTLPPAVSGAGGRAFLANGPYGDAALIQVIDLSAAANAIDTGRVGYTLSACSAEPRMQAGRPSCGPSF